MLLLNYAHPLTPAQLAQLPVAFDAYIRGQMERSGTEARRAQLAALLGTVPDVRSIPTRIDQEAPLRPQAVALADAARLSPEEWQVTPLLLIPPGLSPAAVALLVEIHGRSGYFPALVRLRPVPGMVPPLFEVAEIVDLLGGRAEARDRRYRA